MENNFEQKKLIISESALKEFWDNFLLELPIGFFPRTPRELPFKKKREMICKKVIRSSHVVGRVMESPNILILEAPQLGIRTYLDEAHGTADVVTQFVKILPAPKERAFLVKV